MKAAKKAVFYFIDNGETDPHRLYVLLAELDASLFNFQEKLKHLTGLAKKTTARLDFPGKDSL